MQGRTRTPLAHRLDDLGGALLPCHCLLCGIDSNRALLCPDCELALPWLSRTEALCQTCALPLTSESSYCGQCLHRPPAFSRCLIPFSYAYPLDSLIHRFKYRYQLNQGRALAQLLADYLQDFYRNHPELTLPEVIVPVPLHWTRRLRRGFNQAELIGQDLARLLGIPLHSRICQRHRRTPSQSGLSRKERQRNLRQAFRLTSRGGEAVVGRRIALLDDVVTTTSTTRVLSQLLIDQGAAVEVQVWALARTI